MNFRITMLWLAASIVVSASVPALAAPTECDKFVPRRGCQISVNFTFGVHGDVAVLPNDASVKVVVSNKPPFASCSIAASPSALTRDLGSALGGFITTIGGLGALGGNPQPAANFAEGRAPTPPPNEAARNIDRQYAAIVEREIKTHAYLKSKGDEFKAVQDQVEALWKSNNEQQIEAQVGGLATLLEVKINASEPSIADLNIALKAINDSMTDFYRRYSGDSSVAAWLEEMKGKLDDVNGLGDTYNDFLGGLLHKRSIFKQALQELTNVRRDVDLGKAKYTSQTIGLSGFAEKQVSLTLSCKDDITSTPVADNIIFTAYYVKLPIIDLSAGVVFSLLGRRQIGVMSPTSDQIKAGTNSNGTFAVTDSNRFQVIPMGILEIHNRGWKCWNYVCTLGMAVGAGPNNATGSAQAEFFEGLSFAVQRVSFLFGAHDGRVEELGGGFNIKDPLPTAGYSPIINRRWSVHPAFGITYRIPLR